MDNLYQYWELGLLALMLLLMPIAFVIDKRNKEKRQKKIEEYGFRIVSGDEFKKWADLPRFGILKKGGFGSFNQYFFGQREPMRGTHIGLEFGFFLHFMADGSKTGKRQTATIVKVGRNIPNLALRPESWRDKLKGKFGGEDSDIDFANNEEFSKKYFLESNHPGYINSVFTNEVLDRLAAIDGLWIEVVDGDVLIFKEHDQVINGEKFQSYLDRSIEIVEILSARKIRSEGLGVQSASFLNVELGENS